MKASLLLVLTLSLSSLPLRAEETIADLRARVRELEQENARLRRQSAPPAPARAAKETVATDATAETTVTEPAGRGRSWLGRLMLRRSVFDEKTIAEPAQFTYVRPASADEAWSLDAGVGLALFPIQNQWSLTEIFLGAEYHRNTAPSTLTEQFQTGLIAKTFLFEPGDPFGLNIDTRAGYKTDNVADLQAINTAIDVFPRFPWLATDNLLPLGPAKWRWQPFAGIYYDEVTDTAANLSKGHRVVGRYGAQLQVYPLFNVPRLIGEGKIETSVEMAATYTAWSTLSSSGLYAGDDSSRFFTARITYQFNAPDEVQLFHPLADQSDKLTTGISLIYENGEDPQLGLRDVDQLTLSLTARF